MATSRALLALTALLLLPSCMLGADVAVTQANGKAVVEVTRDGETPCIRGLTVYEGEPQDPPAWNITGDPGTPCVTRVQLGDVPPGFEQDPSRTPFRLKPNHLYVVAVSGVAYSAGARFIAAGA